MVIARMSKRSASELSTGVGVLLVAHLSMVRTALQAEHERFPTLSLVTVVARGCVSAGIGIVDGGPTSTNPDYS